MTLETIAIGIMLAINLLSSFANTWQARRYRLLAAETKTRGDLWVANAERLDRLANTVRRMLEDEAPPSLILETLDADQRSLS